LENIIELRNVTAYRGDTRVFHQLSLDIAQGRNTVILGPNGAGKTTLLKLLARELYPMPDPGSYVKLFGQEIWNVWELRARLGLVSHDLQYRYTGDARGINVILSGFYASIDTWPHQEFSTAQRERAADVAQQLGIGVLLDKRYAEMSTGEQRRFLLARALVNDPGTLVLDEPTSGLDLKACFQYLDTIRALMRAGTTTVLVTHHIHEIPPEIADVVLLKDGKVMARGNKTDVLTSTNLTRLFDTATTLVEANGFYQALPAAK
jgi:iron complex transport system ATP-binding protein